MFEELLKALITNREAYLNNFWVTLGFLLAAIGWFLTSESARDYLLNKDTLIKVCSICIGLLFLIHVFVLLYTYSRSCNLETILLKSKHPETNAELKELLEFYVPPSFYR